MTIEEVYELMIESIDTNEKNQVELSKSRFVIFINDAQDQFMDMLIEGQRNSDTIQKVEQFLVNKPLDEVEYNKDIQRFQLPDDIVRKEEVRAWGVKGCCKTKRFTLQEVKPRQDNFLHSDSHTKPSFEFRESYYDIGDNKLTIYNDETFKFSEVELRYYRYPIRMDIEGYQKEDDTFSRNVNPEWKDIEMRQIVKLAVNLFTKAQLPIKSGN